MTTFKITYMTDPGDGIESTAEFESESDDMCEVLADWFNEGNEYFVTKCEIVAHARMVGGTNINTAPNYGGGLSR